MLPETRYFLHFVFLPNNFYLKNGSTIDIEIFHDSVWYP